MRFAVSNIALPALDHERELGRLAALGIEGIAVAPSRVWRDIWKRHKPQDVACFDRIIVDRLAESSEVSSGRIVAAFGAVGEKVEGRAR